MHAALVRTSHTRTMLPMRIFAALTPDLGQESEFEVVWPQLKVFWLSKDNSTGQSERKKKKGRQGYGID